MTEKLNTDELNWLRELAVADDKVESRIPQVSLGKLLKSGLVETRNMLTLRLTPAGRKRLAVAVPEISESESSRSVRYALFADSRPGEHLRV